MTEVFYESILCLHDMLQHRLFGFLLCRPVININVRGPSMFWPNMWEKPSGYEVIHGTKTRILSVLLSISIYMYI